MTCDNICSIATLTFDTQDVSFAQRSRLRFECARLLRFARVVDLLIAETLAPCQRFSTIFVFADRLLDADGRVFFFETLSQTSLCFKSL